MTLKNKEQKGDTMKKNKQENKKRNK